MSSDKIKNQVLIAVMGQTGSGKSTFINLSTQSEPKLHVGNSVQSCTSAINAAPAFDLDGHKIILYDTPGINDTNKSEIEILQIITSELETKYSKGTTLHGIIYIHRISDIRVRGLKKSNFGIFRTLCDEKSLKNVVILTNMWSTILNKEEGESKIRELETSDDFFKTAVDRGAQLMHHKDDSVESAHEVIRSILKNEREIVDKRKENNNSSAGVEVDKKIAELTDNFEKLKEQIEAAERARKESLEESKKTLAAILKLASERENQDEMREELHVESKKTHAAITNQAEAFRQILLEFEEKRKKDEEEQRRREEAVDRKLEKQREEEEKRRREDEERRKMEKEEEAERKLNEKALMKMVSELHQFRVLQSLCGDWNGEWNGNKWSPKIFNKEDGIRGNGQLIGYNIELSEFTVTGDVLKFELRFIHHDHQDCFKSQGNISADRRSITGTFHHDIDPSRTYPFFLNRC